MDWTRDLPERGEHAEAGEDSEELLLRGAHGLDELAVHAVAEARGRVQREQRGVQALPDGHGAAAACGARCDVIDERGERPRAVGRRPSEPSDGVERLGAEVPAERDPVRALRHGGDDLQPAVGDDGGGAAAGGAVGEGVGAADERVHRDGAV